jgi:hypothetical protein
MQSIVQDIVIQVVHIACLRKEPGAPPCAGRSEVIREFIISAFCGETASEIVIPSRDPGAGFQAHGVIKRQCPHARRGASWTVTQRGSSASLRRSISSSSPEPGSRSARRA